MCKKLGLGSILAPSDMQSSTSVWGGVGGLDLGWEYGLGITALGFGLWIRCRVNSAHIRQSWPDSGLGLSHFLGGRLESLLSCSLIARQSLAPSTRKVDVRLSGKGNPNSQGARPVHLIITMIKRFRTSRLSINNSFSGSFRDAAFHVVLVSSIGSLGLEVQGP